MYKISSISKQERKQVAIKNTLKSPPIKIKKIKYPKENLNTNKFLIFGKNHKMEQKFTFNNLKEYLPKRTQNKLETDIESDHEEYLKNELKSYRQMIEQKYNESEPNQKYKFPKHCENVDNIIFDSFYLNKISINDVIKCSTHPNSKFKKSSLFSQNPSLVSNKLIISKNSHKNLKNVNTNSVTKLIQNITESSFSLTHHEMTNKSIKKGQKKCLIFSTKHLIKTGQKNECNKAIITPTKSPNLMNTPKNMCASTLSLKNAKNIKYHKPKEQNKMKMLTIERVVSDLKSRKVLKPKLTDFGYFFHYKNEYLKLGTPQINLKRIVSPLTKGKSNILKWISPQKIRVKNLPFGI